MVVGEEAGLYLHRTQGGDDHPYNIFKGGRRPPGKRKGKTSPIFSPYESQLILITSDRSRKKRFFWKEQGL